MSIIENIPQNMITEHINWHSRPGNPSGGGRAINPWPPTGSGPAPGSGEEFLNWHQGYIQRFMQWYEAQPESARPPRAQIQPWQSIPTHLKMGMNGWNAQLASEEARIQAPSNFGSLDELGRFLEWSLHSFLHSAAAQMHSEPVLLSFESPRSTFFWQLHGLIDQWRAAWVAWDTRDAEEMDPVRLGFEPITVGTPVTASIALPGEVDRYVFTTSEPGAYQMETRGPTDTVLYLAGPNNPQRLINVNDDGGVGRNARLRYRLPAATYYLYVVHYSSQGTGNYEMAVDRS